MKKGKIYKNRFNMCMRVKRGIKDTSYKGGMYKD